MPDEPQAKPAEEKKSKGALLTILVVVGLMAVEGVTVFTLARFTVGGPAAAHAGDTGEPAGGSHGASDHGGEHGPSPGEYGEVELATCKTVNSVAGKLVALQLRVSALVPQSQVEAVKTLATAKKDRIHDRVNFVFRSAEPSQIKEPGLDTIKRRIKHELDEIFGDEKLIIDVLLPEFIQSGSGV